jgi:hypothetical protein
MELGVSFGIWLAPEEILESVDFSAKGVLYVTQMWAVRQFALGVIFAFATIKRSRAMLTLAYIFFLTMFIGDIVVGTLQKDNGMVMASVVMLAVASAMIFAINKRRNA